MMKRFSQLIRHSTPRSITAWLIVAMTALHFLFLPITPPGFYLDEAATGAHVVAMLHDGTNAHGQPMPLYSESLGGGYTTPVYLYPLVGWASIFGTSELALRAFSMVATLLAILLIALSVKLWLGKRDALRAALAGLVLPWGWLQGSLAWDPALLPLVVAIGLAAFSLLIHKPSTLIRRIMLVVLPLSLIACAYLYPPARLTAPLLFAGAYAVLTARKIVDIRTVVITCLLAAIVCLPLIQFMTQPSSLARAAELNVFHNTSIANGLVQAGINFLGLLSPVFLFITGDPNLRHATGFEGMLGLATVTPIVALIVALFLRAHRRPVFTKDLRLLLWIGAFGVVVSLLGSAFTNEGQPHSLRATAAWPFWLLLITIGWHFVLSSWTPKYVKTLSLGIAVVATMLYIFDFTDTYNERASDSFDVTIREQIIVDHKTPAGYPGLALDYYRTR